MQNFQVLATITNRIDALNVKGSEVAAENSNTRILIDDLRKEKLQHAAALDRRCAPPAAPLGAPPLSPPPRLTISADSPRRRAKIQKMQDDISFLTQAAHAALDLREKVKGKFMAAQRDMQQEARRPPPSAARRSRRSARRARTWAR